MAIFEAAQPVNLRNSGADYQYIYDEYYGRHTIQLNGSQQDVNYFGYFEYDYYGNVYGEVDQIDSYLDSSGYFYSWYAYNGIYDASAILDLTFEDPVGLLDYLFALDDWIYGSPGKDKLDGRRGDDFLDGWRGNDKLWGGSGSDIFYYNDHYKKDKIKDFDLRKDFVDVADVRGINNWRDIKDVATTKHGDTVLKFDRKDVLKIEDIKFKHLDADDFIF